jgi:hypothetical protein
VSETRSAPGGSWFTGSLYFNDFTTIPDLVYGNGKDRTGWLLDLDLFLPAGLNILDDRNTFFFQSVLTSVVAKAFTGVCVVITPSCRLRADSRDHPQRHKYNRCMGPNAFVSLPEPNLSHQLFYR